MSWSDLGDWWLAEVEGDPAYEEIVTPLLLQMLRPQAGRLYLDLGSGEGRVMGEVIACGAAAHGLDLNLELAGRSSHRGPTMVGKLPDLSYITPDSYDGAFCVLVMEHVENHRALFSSVADVVKQGGTLAVVMNHPAWTAPGSTPITDDYGEVLWRPGAYFSDGSTEEPAGDETVTFHHRTMSELLTAAAAAGWSLEEAVELPHHELEDQQGIPRLLACRWQLLP